MDTVRVGINLLILGWLFQSGLSDDHIAGQWSKHLDHINKTCCRVYSCGQPSVNTGKIHGHDGGQTVPGFVQHCEICCDCKPMGPRNYQCDLCLHYNKKFSDNCTKTLHAWYGRAQFVDPDNCSYLYIFQSTKSASDMEESASIMSESTSVMTESSATMSRSTSVMTDRSEAMSSSTSVFTGIPSIKTGSSMSAGFKTTLSSTQMTSYLTSSEKVESSTPVAQHQLRILYIAIPLVCVTVIILVMSITFLKRRRRRPSPDNGVTCRQLPHPNQTPSNVANVANCVTLETNDESAYHLLHGGKELGDYHTYELADLLPQGGNNSKHKDTSQRPNNTKPFQIFDQSGSNHLREEPASRIKSNCHSDGTLASHTGMGDETANPTLSPDEEYDRLKRPLALDLHTVAGNVYGKLDDPKRSDRKFDGPDSVDYFVLEKQDENQPDSSDYFVLEKQENEIKVDIDRDDHVYFVLE